MNPAIHAWAAMHGVSQAALQELRTIFRLNGDCAPAPVTAGIALHSEAGV